MALFVPLDASYDQDPKVLDLDDERAELLFLRSLAYSKRNLHDGVIHRRALPTFAPFADQVPPADLAAELVRVGLWVEHPKGWRVAAWLKRNPGSEEILTPAKGREMAHQRHHVKTGRPKEGCPFCFPGPPVDSAEDPQVNAQDAMRGCGADAVRDAQHAMPESESESESQPPSTSVKNHSDREPDHPPSTAVDQQTFLAAVAAVAKLEAGTRSTDGAWVAGIRREILTGPDPDRRDRITAALTAGQTPDAIAAAWTTTRPDPLNGDPGPRHRDPGPDVAGIYAAAEARRQAQLAGHHRAPLEATAAARAAARAALRPTPVPDGTNTEPHGTEPTRSTP